MNLKNSISRLRELGLETDNIRSDVRRLGNEELVTYLLLSDRHWVNKGNHNWIFSTSVYEELLSRLNNINNRTMDF